MALIPNDEIKEIIAEKSKFWKEKCSIIEWENTTLLNSHITKEMINKESTLPDF